MSEWAPTTDLRQLGNLMSSSQVFRESNLFGAPIRDLGLMIEGTRLAPVIDEFRAELAQRGITEVVPRFHLSTEWGVPFGTVVIGIPFYLAHPDLTALHGEQVGHIEGFNHADILRYLRHEMGHVINYAYKLYDLEAWVKLFGSITQPYREDYRPQPFSRRFVRHLPGWYAQKHPDEDWSETFAVWMTPGRDWRADYAQLPTALAKLEFCAADDRRARRAARDGDRARRGRQRHRLLARAVLPKLRRRRRVRRRRFGRRPARDLRRLERGRGRRSARNAARGGADSPPRAPAHGGRVSLDGPFSREDAQLGAQPREARRGAEAGLSARRRGRSGRRRDDARRVARDELRPSRRVFSGDAGAGADAGADVGAVPRDADADAVGADCQRCR